MTETVWTSVANVFQHPKRHIWFRYNNGMAELVSAIDFLPDVLTYSSLKRAALGCKGCELYKNATQTVFGEGDIRSGVVFVGEQPGD